jgi:two-component system LytT family response regulator
MKTILVDDEKVAIHRLKQSLANYPSIQIMGEATNGAEAVLLINAMHPDLVFLDIQMPGLNGFEVLDQLEYTPMIVFVTAYEEYAVKAFEKNSLDYLLKPVEHERLSITLKRIMENENQKDTISRIKQFIAESSNKYITTIPVRLGNKINLVPIGEIYFFEATDKYISIHTKDEVKLIDYSLTYLQDRLPDEFIRIHRTFIINTLKIKEIHKYFKGTYLLVMADQKSTKIKAAYSYSKAIREKLLLP